VSGITDGELPADADLDPQPQEPKEPAQRQEDK